MLRNRKRTSTTMVVQAGYVKKTAGNVLDYEFVKADILSRSPMIWNPLRMTVGTHPRRYRAAGRGYGV